VPPIAATYAAAVAREVERLRALVGADPRRVEADARAALDGGADGDDRPGYSWVLGLALRELGRLDEARDELEAAVSAAAAAGDDQLSAQATTSLAFVVAQLGSLERATQLLLQVEPAVAGAEHARVIGQLGTIAYWTGDLDGARRMLSDALAELEGFDEPLAQALYRTNLGATLSLLGELDAADDELGRTIELADGGRYDLVSGAAWATAGFVATLRGDLPEALVRFEAAEDRYDRAGAAAVLPRLHADHAQALADAGLLPDAVDLVSKAIDAYRRQGQATELAGVLLTSASIRLSAGDAAGASGAARDAEALLAGQGRDLWATVASSVALQAAAQADGDLPDEPSGAELAGQLETVADQLDAFGWRAEALRSRLVAARLRAEQGATAGLPAAVRTAVAAGRADDRILLAHVDALVALGDGDADGAEAAVGRGLDVAIAVQAGLGSIETRAHAARHGHQLVELGARLAIGAGDARRLLERIEATRVMAATLPSVRPPDHPETAALLSELRSVELTVADPAIDPDQREAAAARRLVLEVEVQRRSRRQRGDGSTVDLSAGIDDAISCLGPAQLVAHAALDGRLHAVTVGGGEIELHDLGDLSAVRHAVEGVAFALNRLNRDGGSEASRLAAAEMLFALADDLSDLLLPPPVVDAMAPVVVVPTAVLHDVPWGLLPPLAGRPVVVNPSFTGWARAARRRGAAARGRTPVAGFVAGPGLDFAETEIDVLAGCYPEATRLTADAATGRNCLELFGSCELVHVACHGAFRRDNPLFSSIHVADGPLNVYDFERLDRVPETIVLSACSVAGAKALQGGSLLGLATALITLGAATVVAPLTPISDAAAVTVMQRFHRALVEGATPAHALAAATLGHDVADPTAAAFVALGA